MSIVYLRKSSDEVINHCHCGDGRISYPGQMDCPWCGCGWLFSCLTCRKAFTFAEGFELDSTLEALARESIRQLWDEDPKGDDVAAWAGDMEQILEDVEVGKRYVIIDGQVIPADCEGAEFNGWFASHKLESLPQVDALNDSEILDKTLALPKYWIDRELPDCQ